MRFNFSLNPPPPPSPRPSSNQEEESRFFQALFFHLTEYMLFSAVFIIWKGMGASEEPESFQMHRSDEWILDGMEDLVGFSVEKMVEQQG